MIKFIGNCYEHSWAQCCVFASLRITAHHFDAAPDPAFHFDRILSFTLMRIRILPVPITFSRIWTLQSPVLQNDPLRLPPFHCDRILLYTLMRIRILLFTLMRIRILPFTFPQIWTLQCSKMTLKGSNFSL
jgi:hypothetical protein